MEKTIHYAKLDIATNITNIFQKKDIERKKRNILIFNNPMYIL